MKNNTKFKFTESTIKSIETKDKAYEVHDLQDSKFIVRVQPTGLKTFYLIYTNSEGKRKRIKLGRYGIITLKQAEKLKASFSGDVANGIDPQEIRRQKVQQTKVIEASCLGNFITEVYEPWVLAERKSGDSTLARLKSNFSHLYENPIVKITIPVIDKWRTKEKNRGLKASTINRNLNALRSVMSKAAEWDIVDNNPIQGIKDLAEPKDIKVRFLFEDETKRLREALTARNTNLIYSRKTANYWRKRRGYSLYPDMSQITYADHLEPMVLLAMQSGIRIGELLTLKWFDIDFTIKKLTVRAENAKNNMTRHVSLNIIALKVLKQWKEQTKTKKYDFIFHHPDGERYKSIKTAWSNLLKKAKIKQFRFHDLRHNFASQLVMKGVALNTVRELLGHSDITTTLRYAHLGEQHKLDAVALLVV